jgi:hypothetical protein
MYNTANYITGLVHMESTTAKTQYKISQPRLIKFGSMLGAILHCICKDRQ